MTQNLTQMIASPKGTSPSGIFESPILDQEEALLASNTGVIRVRGFLQLVEPV